jgi:hypothetical protein
MHIQASQCTAKQQRAAATQISNTLEYALSLLALLLQNRLCERKKCIAYGTQYLAGLSLLSAPGENHQAVSCKQSSPITNMKLIMILEYLVFPTAFSKSTDFGLHVALDCKVA